MPTPEEAEEILKSLGLPKGQQNERSALTLLALANLDPNAAWTATEPVLLRTVDIMEFMRVRAEPGTHQIRFAYRLATDARIGMWISVMSLLALIALMP